MKNIILILLIYIYIANRDKNYIFGSYLNFANINGIILCQDMKNKNKVIY